MIQLLGEHSMSVIQFLTSGGMANVGGDLSEEQKKIANEIVKKFAAGVKKYGFQLQVSATLLKVQQCNYLFVAQDSASLHFVFADAPGQNILNYRNLSKQGRLELQSITRQIDIEVGTPIWAFTCGLNISESELENHINKIVDSYVNSVLQSQKKPNKKISEEAISNPEIAIGLEKFRLDFPLEQKTAFIIMQFGKTKSHDGIVECIKNTLTKFNIKALRGDDKEYMDDLFLNIKTYMHGCDFGIAIYERITEDNFNSNVSLEVGYMMGLGKEVLFLKDSTLKNLQTDLTGKLYKQFDTLNIETTLPQQIEKWLRDKGFVN